MSKGTSPKDCEVCLKIWKAEVTKRRGAYRQRLKLAHLTRGNESSSWLTPLTQDSKHSGANPGPNGERDLLVNQVNWPTPTARDHKNVGTPESYRERSKKHAQPLPEVVINGPQDPENPNLTGKNLESWPTPSTPSGGPLKDGSAPQGMNGGKGHREMMKGVFQPGAKLNPNWVEQLMGLPIGWTDLGSWGTE